VTIDTKDMGKLFKNKKTYAAAGIMFVSILLEYLGYTKESTVIWDAGIVLGLIGFRHKMGRGFAKLFLGLGNKEEPIPLTKKHDSMEDVRNA
jgi:hypothetical protein